MHTTYSLGCVGQGLKIAQTGAFLEGGMIGDGDGGFEVGVMEMAWSDGDGVE